MNPTSPIAASVIRALLTAVVTFGATALSTYQATLRVLDDGTVLHGSWEVALVAGGSAAFATLVARVGGEGLFDQARDSGQPPAVNAGDVGAT